MDPRFVRDELLAALEPVAVENGEHLDCIEGVSTDTRTLWPGNLFVAFAGERFDGHTFVEDAIERGASALVLDVSRRGQYSIDRVPTIWVRDTLCAYGNLARAHRRRFSVPVVAIAGAVGKTTTKDIAAHLLTERYIVHRTPGNWNNRVGVPHVLLGIKPEHTAVVVELGTNRPGEIAELCRIAEPTHGVITAIAEEHLELLGSLDGVEQEETALFRWIGNHGGIACINRDDERLTRYVELLPMHVTFGFHPSSQLQATFTFDPQTLFPILSLAFEGMQVSATLAHPGYGAAFCAIAASALALSVGLDLETIAHGLNTYQPAPPHGYARMLVEAGDGGIVILNDCYNANPASMRAALETLAAYPTRGKRIALLGDMLELGDATSVAHRSVLSKAVERADAIVVLGEAMVEAMRSMDGSIAGKVVVAQSHSEAASIIRSMAGQRDVILVKGSRSMMLERVIELLRQHSDDTVALQSK
jgi:UDP-N-acetylmuramoyl-tripeptide--D-alanyl-D-alanine ligase